MIKKYKFIIFLVTCFTLLFPLASFSAVEIWEQPFGGHDSYNTGDQISFNGDVYVSLVDGNVWSPSTYPNGWELIENSEPGYNPDEWTQPSGAHDCYQMGAIIQFENRYYKSLIDANVWSPAVYPAGWQEMTEVDSDFDGVSDIVEMIAGTDEYDSSDVPAAVSSGSLLNNTANGSQRIEYNYSRYPGYSASTNVPAVFSPNTIDGVYLPVPSLEQVSYGEVVVPDSNFNVDGSSIHNIAEVTYPECRSEETQYEMAFPISDESRGLPKEFFKLYKDECGTWEEVEISKVTFSAAYAPVPGAGRYMVATYDHVYMVDDNFPLNTGSDNKYKTIQAAFNSIISFQNNNPTDISRHLVCVGKGAYHCVDVTVPKLTGLRGGFVDQFINISNPEEAVDRNPKNDISLIKTGTFDGITFTPDFTKAAFEITMPYGESGVKELGIEIDGFEFEGNKDLISSATDVTSPAGAINISCYGHLTNVHVSNCIFTKQVGTISGAVFICNASKIFFESCIFVDNRSYSGGYSIALASAPVINPACPACPAPPSRVPAVVDLNNISGSAVTVYEWASCGVETEFNGCVFTNNITGFENAQDAADLTKIAGGTFAIIGNAGPGRAVKILNSTFYNNSVNVALSAASDRFAGSVLKVDADDFSVGRTYTPKETPVIIMNSIMRGNLGSGTAYYAEVVGVELNTDITYWTNYEMTLEETSPGEYNYTSPTVLSNIHTTYFGTSDLVKSVSNCVIGNAGLTSTPDANGNLDVSPSFLSPADGDGDDNKWGTTDDGLSLQANSPLRNAGSLKLLEEHAGTGSVYSKSRYYDVRNMPRLGNLDIGGYESFLNILCIGDINTLGVVDWTYRASLKQKFTGLNWAIDFSGSEITPPSGSGSWDETGLNSCRGSLEEDKGLNPTLYDIQHISYESARLSTFNLDNPETFDLTTKLNESKPDIVLYMAGSRDIESIDRSNISDQAALAAAVLPYNNSLARSSETINNWIDAQPCGRNQIFYIQGKIPQNKQTDDLQYIYAKDELVFEFNKNINLSNSNSIAETYNQGFTNSDMSINNDYSFTKTGYEKIAKGWFDSIYNLLKR